MYILPPENAIFMRKTLVRKSCATPSPHAVCALEPFWPQLNCLRTIAEQFTCTGRLAARNESSDYIIRPWGGDCSVLGPTCGRNLASWAFARQGFNDASKGAAHLPVYKGVGSAYISAQAYLQAQVYLQEPNKDLSQEPPHHEQWQLLPGQSYSDLAKGFGLRSARGGSLISIG